MELQKQNQRLLSLDAFRGFDMLFIMGGADLIIALANVFQTPFWNALGQQMHHVPWHGLCQHDTIFPLFLFIAGISFPFSLEKQREQGKSQAAIVKKVIYRGLMLILLGCIYNGLLKFDFANQRYASVLGRIGSAWMFAALLFVFFRMKVRVCICAAILIGYWLIMAFVPVPGAEGLDPFSLEGNWVGYIDRLLLPGRLLEGGYMDPEGLFSVVPAIGTAMLGMFTGEWVKFSKEGLTENKKVLYMIGVGIVLLVIGLLWSTVFPINKKLWTSSFVCVVGAYSLLMFALFYYIIDVKGYRKWTFFFKVIGMNSITIYLAQDFIVFGPISDRIFGGITSLFPIYLQRTVQVLFYISLTWSFLYFLYRRRIFLKV